MQESFNSKYIAEILGGSSTNDDITVNNFSSLSSASKDSISFYNDIAYKSELQKTNAGIVILKESDSSLRNGPCIFVDDPYLAFAKIAKIFDKKSYSSEIHTTSIIPSNTNIGKNVSIGSFVEVGQNSKIGDNSIIMSNTYIGTNVIIGKNVKIYPNVYIESDVIIGNDCIFYPGVRIGTDGFGYARAKDKSWVKIPQTGSVIIGDRVDIGSNSTIDKGAIDNTIIENGVKIDNLVQVGHNCIIGENTIIAGCAGVAGSTKIGKNCMIGGAAMIKGHITIADDTIISGGTGIGKNVENPGKRFTNVFPYNLEHKDWLRIANNLKKMGKKND